MKLKCEFRIAPWYHEPKDFFTCFITSATITKRKTEIEDIVGTHLPNKNKDVLGLVLSNTAAEYFPRGLNKKFPNLKALMLKNSGLKEISMQDLIGLENLETLLFLSEKLESLPDNLLTHMRKLSRITFYRNELEFVSSTLLAPIINNEIKRIRFYTPKIKAGYGPDYYEPNKVETLQELINITDTNGGKFLIIFVSRCILSRI